MYTVVLAIHNIFRWIVAVLAILAVVRAYLGWLGRRDWTARDRQINSFFGMSLDIQFLLGLILYIFLSPITRLAFANLGAAMRDSTARFFTLEHILYMVVAVVLVHMGTVLARRADDPIVKHRQAAIFFTLAVLAIILGMPWFRPLFPGLGGI